MNMETTPFYIAAQEYKLACMAAEIAEKQKDKCREALLQLANGQEIKEYGISITKIEPQPTVDWKAVQIRFKLTPEKLEPFMKPKDPYFKITLQKEIVL